MSTRQRTLGLTGLTINTMALLAPGAFLWTTFQLHAASVDAQGAHTAADMWPGVVVAVVVAFLTAFAFAELAHRYPEAGSASAYYFAEKAFLERETSISRRWVRVVKFYTGWAAHLFYWVYPGVMLAFMATLISYLFKTVGGVDVPLWGQILFVWLIAFFIGLSAMRGISGSTLTSIIINVIQLTTLVMFSALALMFRDQNPLNVPAQGWYHADVLSVFLPHSIRGMLLQAGIAIIILAGFESSTTLAAKARNPKRDIPYSVIISLLIQGLLAYLVQYFAASYSLGAWFGGDLAGRGIQAAAASAAPIGDMAIALGDTILEGNGIAFMIVLAVTVGAALLATTLSAMNTGVRISFAMAQDTETPELLGLVQRQVTPYTSVLLMVITSGIVGTIGMLGGVISLTGITLASNLGTFALYALICLLTLIAFRGQSEFNMLRHTVLPVLGLALNAFMLLAILAIGLTSGGAITQATLVAAGIGVFWFVVSVLYILIIGRRAARRA
ncbi:MAG: APC family permease [Chloroflexi bacterium]|nr:APC family permease [Chloroflexota bacterium]